MLYSSLAASLLSSASEPSADRTSSPEAHRLGNQVKTRQPPQLPPKYVPETPSFLRSAIAWACSLNSAIDFGPASGSRPASR